MVRLAEDEQLVSQGGDIDPEGEDFAGLVAWEVMKMLHDLGEMVDAGTMRMTVEIRKRALYVAYDNYDTLKAMLRDVTDAEVLGSGWASELNALAETIIPFIQNQYDVCGNCGHPRKKHRPAVTQAKAADTHRWPAEGCNAYKVNKETGLYDECDCTEFYGPPDVRLFWTPRTFSRIREAIARMRNTILKYENGEWSARKAVEELNRSVEIYTNDELTILQIRHEMVQNPIPPFKYQLWRTNPPGQEDPNAERTWKLVFPKLTARQRDKVLEPLKGLAEPDIGAKDTE